jgi:hypothetical protein
MPGAFPASQALYSAPKTTVPGTVTIGRFNIPRVATPTLINTTPTSGGS